MAVADDKICRGNACRPENLATIHPCCAQACGACGFNIQRRIISHVKNLFGRQRERLSELSESERMRLGDANLARVEGGMEEIRNTHAFEIGVAVRQRAENITGLQTLERGTHVREYVDVVARGSEDFERPARHRFIVTALHDMACQDGNTEIAVVVSAIRLVARELHAGLAHFLDGPAFGQPGAMLLHPGPQARLGTLDHRLDVPERIIEIKRNGADIAKHCAYDRPAYASLHSTPKGSDMADLTLVIGNRNYSSWSLRPWILMRHLGLEFTEHLIPLDTDEFKDEVAKYGPSGRVPVLRHGSVTVWDSLAICEYIAELTGKGWPKDPAARAMARSVSAEMHSGFVNLRMEWPMNARARNRRTPMTPGLDADIERVEEIWIDCRRAYGSAGPWLFGEYSIADAMYAPVVLRFNTYGAQLSDTARWYFATVLEDGALQEWVKEAQGEPWKTDSEKVGLAP